MSLKLYFFTVKSLNADVSSVSPSSERLEELWVHMQKMELRYLWEYGDEKTGMN